MLCLKSKRGERMFWGVGMAVVSTRSWRCRGQIWVHHGILEPGFRLGAA